MATFITEPQRQTPIFGEYDMIVLDVALNTWTNFINLVGKTEIDFPVVSARKTA